MKLTLSLNTNELKCLNHCYFCTLFFVLCSSPKHGKELVLSIIDLNCDIFYITYQRPIDQRSRNRLSTLSLWVESSTWQVRTTIISIGWIVRFPIEGLWFSSSTNKNWLTQIHTIVLLVALNTYQSINPSHIYNNFIFFY